MLQQVSHAELVYQLIDQHQIPTLPDPFTKLHSGNINRGNEVLQGAGLARLKVELGMRMRQPIDLGHAHQMTIGELIAKLDAYYPDL